HPDGRAVREKKGHAVAVIAGDLAVDEEVYQLRLAAEGEGGDAVAVAAVADGEEGDGAMGELEWGAAALGGACRERRRGRQRHMDRESGVDLGDVDSLAGADLEFVFGD